MSPLKEGTATRPPQVLAGQGLDNRTADQKAADQKTADQKAADKEAADQKAAADQHAAGVFRFKIDGVVKTISGPVTGKTLRAMAGEIDGYPVNLSPDVPNNDEPYELKLDQEFTTK